MRPIPALFLIMLTALVSPAAHAFPTPDLVINLFGSVAQLVGMLTASLGAAWWGWRKPGVAHSSRWQLMMAILLALLLSSLGANLYQYWQHADAQARRLQTNLLRPPANGNHPIQKRLALTPSELHAWQQQGKPLNLIDVRETEEVELGRLAGSRHSRYADLFGSHRSWLRKDMPNVLICDSGLRSGEICTELAARGLPCRYVQGGYGRWLAESRPMQGGARGAAPRLGLPRYQGDNQLLDTPEVEALVQQQEALLLDVRSPTEFARFHLAGAINLPVREQPSRELANALAALPKQPLIAVCYDSRSCFYSKLIGLKLRRAGADFRGRYTVPQEYPTPSRLRGSLVYAHFDRIWDQTISILGTPAHGFLQGISQRSGSLAFAVILLAVLLRLLLIPASLIAERDRWRSRALAARLEHWRAQGCSPEQHTRLRKRLLQRSQIKPWRNLLLGLLQLLLLASCLAAVTDLAEEWGSAAGWLTAWNAPDPYHLLPLALTLALLAYLPEFITFPGRWRWPVLVGLAALLGWSSRSLSAAIHLYLLASILFMIIQQHLAHWRWGPAHWPSLLRQRRPEGSSGLTRLREAGQLADISPKAAHLSRLMQAGLPVPKGWVIACQDWRQPARQSHLLDALQTTCRRQHLQSLAVRSAAGSEDQQSSAQAGRFLSRLHVAPAALHEALEAVCAAQYREDEPSYILVQAMIDAEWAGVLFSEHPDHSGSLLIEMAPGAGSVVSGAERPLAFQFGRNSLQPQHTQTPPIPLRPLLQLARQVEQILGGPQDIEWAYRAGQFYLLQARPISRRVADGGSPVNLRGAERSRLLQIGADASVDQPWLKLDDLAAELPQASPCSLSLLQRLRAANGATDRAWSRLGFDYPALPDDPPAWLTAFGQTRQNRPVAEALSLRASWLAQLNFAFKAERLAQRFEQDFLPAFRDNQQLYAILDLQRLDHAQLLQCLERWCREFVEVIYVEAEVINLAAGLSSQTASLLLEKAGLDPSNWLRSACPTPDVRAADRLRAVGRGEATLEEYLTEFGHRAGHDFELAEPRYQEQATRWAEYAGQLAQTPQRPASPLPPLPPGRLLVAATARAQRFLALKEEAKHETCRALANLRRLLLTIDNRLQLGGNLFLLPLEEIIALPAQIDPPIKTLLARRQAERAAYATVHLPASLSIAALETLDLDARPNTTPDKAPSTLVGIRVAGKGAASGQVRQLDDPLAVPPLQASDILVLASADPAWIPLFPQVAGVICETGGRLCHAAIMAREFGLPAIFSAQGARQQLRTGQTVVLHEDGRIETR